MIGETFSIEFPILKGDIFETLIAASCTSNSNYYTSGAQRSTCCCGCDKDSIVLD